LQRKSVARKSGGKNEERRDSSTKLRGLKLRLLVACWKSLKRRREQKLR